VVLLNRGGEDGRRAIRLRPDLLPPAKFGMLGHARGHAAATRALSVLPVVRIAQKPLWRLQFSPCEKGPLSPIYALEGGDIEGERLCKMFYYHKFGFICILYLHSMNDAIMWNKKLRH